jgi:hypothetical protein
LGAVAARAGEKSLTCSAEELDPKSYAFTTKAQALAVTADRHDFADSFELGKHARDLAELNLDSLEAAERAREIDPRNLMAHGILARAYLNLDDPEQAEVAWKEVLDGGGAVVWTATIYNVDARSYFVLAFDRRSLRVYRFGAVVARLEKGFYDIPRFPGPDDEAFWKAMGGCLSPSFVPEAEIPWSEVREIKAGNWVLWFKLNRSVKVSSDRGKRKTIDEIKVNLHGRTGELEVYKPTGECCLALRGRGPVDYQDLVRWTIVRFVDPERRIAMPPVKPGVGW